MPESAFQKPRENARDATERLVDTHGGLLYQLALRFCGSADEADDLVQEVFLQAFRAWEGFRGDADEKTWLYRIAARACQRMHRKRAGEPERIGSLEELLPFGQDSVGRLPTELDDGLRVQLRKEARERVEQAIVALPTEFRVPLILKEIVGFGVREVAAVLDLEEGTVRSRVHRARLKLRALVDGAIPRAAGPVPPPTYDEQTCLDLLNAKQDALDRGVAFESSVICRRCQAVFASLDVTQQACRDLAADTVPEALRTRLAARLAAAEAGGGR